MCFKRLNKKVNEEFVQIKKIEFPDGLEQSIYNGKSVILTELPKIYFKNTKGYFPDFLSGPTAVLIISEKVKKFLENSSEAKYLNFIETKIISKGIIEKYFVLNILDKLACLDRDKAVFDVPEENPKVIVNLKKMVIDINKTQGRKLFYMKEYPVIIYIKESFADEMREAGINDIRLLPLIGSTN
jgi:hypothetical protein